MVLEQLSDALREWALRLLAACGLPDARNVRCIHLVEVGCICFTTMGAFSGRERAKTALLKEGTNGATVYRIVHGWDLPDWPANHVIQGNLQPVQEEARK